MTIPSDTVTYTSLSGDSVTFDNSYDSSINALEQQGIELGEQTLAQYMGGGPTTLHVQFGTGPLGAGAAAENSFNTVAVSYAQLVSALRAHDTTAAGQIAVAGLPAADPSNGAGFALPVAYAQHLGLADASLDQGLDVVLNSGQPWNTASDVAAAVEHEISEGGLGRIGSDGVDNGGQWSAMDLFRFLPDGTRDYTGGADNALTYFGLDPSHVGTIAFNNQLDSSGYNNGQDLADWASTRGDPFGPLMMGSGNSLSQTDIQVLQALGWTSPLSGPTLIAPDDFANGMAGGSLPFGHIAAGGTATGAIQYGGDTDWFMVQLPQQDSLEVTLAGAAAAGGTLAGAHLILHDASGKVIAESDPSAGGADGAAKLDFVTPLTAIEGATVTYYLEVGADAPGATGSYSISLSAGAPMDHTVVGEEVTVLRMNDDNPAITGFTAQLNIGIQNGSLSESQALTQIIHQAEATTSVASTSYQFFTGQTPTYAGMDYLVSPTGPNANNLNSAYYQQFSMENRYINFAVNLGSGQGAGAASFANLHATESLSQTLIEAYTTIFGGAPSADKVDHLLNDQVSNGLGGTYARENYFASYGADGLTGVGTKAAMVGWLMAEAVKADLGAYALANDAYLHDFATGANGVSAGVDMIGHYASPAMAYTGG